MKIRYTRINVLQALVIYSVGDSAAALLLECFTWTRLAGIMLVGALVYAWEIPAWFAWIDRRTTGMRGVRMAAARTGLALLYFNPLWIARHLLFLAVCSPDRDAINWGLLRIGGLSWLVNIPITIIGNAIIQVVLPLRWRLAGSATFSGLMAVYYALSGVWFSAK